MYTFAAQNTPVLVVINAGVVLDDFRALEEKFQALAF